MTYSELKRLASPQLMAIYDKIEKAHLAFRNDGNKNIARKESLYFIAHNSLKDPVLNAELDVLSDEFLSFVSHFISPLLFVYDVNIAIIMLSVSPFLYNIMKIDPAISHRTLYLHIRV